MREPDALDYALICAVALLAYLHLPWRPAIRRTLRGWVDWLTSARLGLGIEPYVLVLALLGSLFLVVLIEGVPGGRRR